MKKITVIGCGSTGNGAAGLMSILGHNITLYDNKDYEKLLENVDKCGGILLHGKVKGMGKNIVTTTDVEKAVRGAEIIMVHVPAFRHEEVARAISPYLEDGQHILITPGILGSFSFRKIFKECSMNKDVIVSELEGNTFPCRLTGDAEVLVGLPFKNKKRIATLPASDVDKAIESLKGIFECTANKNVIEGVMNANNLVMHMATTLLSMARIEKTGDDFNLFKEGFTPAVKNCIDQVREERLKVIEAIGLTEHKNPLMMANKLINYADYKELEVFVTLNGPSSSVHRYVLEDCGNIGAFILSVANMMEIDVPVLESCMTLLAVSSGEDFMNKGMTLENLGFDSVSSMEEVYSLI